jgi:hypothetical protein
VALAYHRAWTSGDLDGAMTHVANDVVCDAPAGRTAGPHTGVMIPFVGMLTAPN